MILIFIITSSLKIFLKYVSYFKSRDSFFNVLLSKKV